MVRNGLFAADFVNGANNRALGNGVVKFTGRQDNWARACQHWLRRIYWPLMDSAIYRLQWLYQFINMRQTTGREGIRTGDK